jgi:prepilin-type N-terminal cleavage/methylation domain-containing protein
VNIAVKKAFTLAEVLITLAIIGVVAALSIPSVVRNYQETQYKVAYKSLFRFE